MVTLKKEAEQYCKIFKEYEECKTLFKGRLMSCGYGEVAHKIFDLLNFGISLDKILKTLEPKYNDLCKASSIADCLKAKLSVKKIQEISKYDSLTIDRMLNCILKKIPNEKIDLLKNDSFDSLQSGQIYKAIYYDNLTMEEIDIFKNEKFNDWKMNIIRMEIKAKKLSIEEIKKFAKPELTVKQMAKIRNKLLKKKGEK